MYCNHLFDTKLRDLQERKRQLRSRGREASDTSEVIDRDISILEAELKFKMKLREKALDQKRQDIDDEIEIKIRERDQLMEDRRLIFGYPQETRLSRDRERAREANSLPRQYRSSEQHNHSSRSRSERSSSHSRYESPSPPPYYRGRSRSPSPLPYYRAFCDREGRSRSRSRDLRNRSRSRSLSTERAPSFGHISPRSPRTRARSLSPSRSVTFDESLNSHHRYRYHRDDAPHSTYDSGFSEELYTRDSGTNTPIIRNGREIKLKKERDEKPPWKYWKSESVPEVMDPPYHEPYSQSAVAEPLELRDTNIRTGGKTLTRGISNDRYFDRFEYLQHIELSPLEC